MGTFMEYLGEYTVITVVIAACLSFFWWKAKSDREDNLHRESEQREIIKGLTATLSKSNEVIAENTQVIAGATITIANINEKVGAVDHKVDLLTLKIDSIKER